MNREDALNATECVLSKEHRSLYEGVLKGTSKGGETQGAANAKNKTGFCSDASLLAAGVGAMRTRIKKNVKAGRNISLILCRKCCPRHEWTIGARTKSSSGKKKFVDFNLNCKGCGSVGSHTQWDLAGANAQALSAEQIETALASILAGHTFEEVKGAMGIND